jgi:hypothetical protein
MIVALLQLGGTTQAFIITASLHLGLSIVVFESREINAQQDAPSAPSGLDIYQIWMHSQEIFQLHLVRQTLTSLKYCLILHHQHPSENRWSKCIN